MTPAQGSLGKCAISISPCECSPFPLPSQSWIPVHSWIQPWQCGSCFVGGLEERVGLCKSWCRAALETRLLVGKAIPFHHLPAPTGGAVQTGTQLKAAWWDTASTVLCLPFKYLLIRDLTFKGWCRPYSLGPLFQAPATREAWRCLGTAHGGVGLSAQKAVCQGSGIDFHGSAVLTLHWETWVCWERERDRQTLRRLQERGEEGGLIGFCPKKKRANIEQVTGAFHLCIFTPILTPPPFPCCSSAPLLSSLQASLGGDESFSWCKLKMWCSVAAWVSRGGREAGVGAAGRNQLIAGR